MDIMDKLKGCGITVFSAKQLVDAHIAMGGDGKTNTPAWVSDPAFGAPVLGADGHTYTPIWLGNGGVI